MTGADSESVIRTSCRFAGMQSLGVSNELILCYPSKTIVCKRWSRTVCSVTPEGGKCWCGLLLRAEMGALAAAFKYIRVFMKAAML